jgi:hypothetical protein
VTVFDLLFLASFFASLIALGAAAIFSLRGRNQAAVRILWNWSICAAVYVTISLLVGFAGQQRVLKVGEPWCFDDWCLTAEKVDRSTEGAYSVALRISSTAKRITQRAKGAWIYLIDDQGRRYTPTSGADDVPLDVLLAPGQEVETSRAFQLPSRVQAVGLITGHGGPYCGAMSVLIVGGAGCLFRRPTMIGID